MPVFVALLRGINVGKHRRVAMADVRSALTAGGHADVSTYLQSGNVILATDERASAEVERSIEEALRAALELEIVVIVRTPSELATIVQSNPFLERGADPSALHVGFLKSEPAETGGRALAGADYGRDEFELRESELYLLYPDGLGRSKMTAASFERALRTPMTVRNWRVVSKLAQLSAAAE